MSSETLGAEAAITISVDVTNTGDRAGDEVVQLYVQHLNSAVERPRQELKGFRIGLDFFDASINRIAAWVLGARNVLRAALIALLEPTDRLRELEASGDHTAQFYTDGTLLKRPITPADQAEAIFLLLTQRLRQTTGQIITVDGGLHEAFLG